ncbi:MAG: DEAD/DEAH box helicase, partial [Verrucomicrobia bacterium]|nr:DEAD/DEAH box helicase [Verrucomicrobiota bacterium]
MATHTFHYHLDQELSRRYRAPVVSLNLPKALDAAALLAMASDKPLMNSLIDNELDWRRRESKTGRVDTHTPFSFFRLRPSLSYELLQKLSCTQKLLYNTQPLLCDFFSRLSLEYLVEPRGQEELAIIAFLSSSSTSYKLSECSLLLQGAPHMVIKDRFLRFIDPEVSWQELSGFEQEKIVSKNDYKKWLKELQSQEHSPKVHELQISQEKEPQIDPLPVLLLADTTCAFANLFMQIGARRTPFNEIAPSQAEKGFESDLLEAGFCKKPTASTRYYCPTDRAVAAVQFLLELGWKVYDKQENEFFALGECRASIHQGELQGSCHFGSVEIDIAQLAKAVSKNEKMISLGFKKTGLLSLDKQSALYSLLKQIDFVSGTLKIPKEALSLAAELVEKGTVTVTDPEERQLLRAIGNPDLLPLEPLGTTFKGILRAYQQTGVNWMKQLFKTGSGGLLADEMGLGKTVQVLAFLSTHQSLPRTLVVAPTTLLHNWKQEAHTFLPSSSCLIFHGAKRNATDLLDGFDIIITSYGTLRADLPLFQKEQFDCLIVDEA